ncbi:dihydrodipicolinate synthase family protein [Pelagibacterium sp. 26DY04]|uniref:dihydrodipicolinate synthase family protein n=1 Tax=Pelagibacterium sp. 26DY04 TaxID=2967130 RepID=UPI002815D020|nr:dihydrodipicolinate synthase family protein [Pelagibacterium sp. 26DY04]WMT87320.1 dihydrodipicolinate synthase family protein [Pelagibacterium sp. 26DY04]
MTTSKPIILTAIPVAFAEDGSLSIEGNTAILKKCAASGVDGAFVLGTTGEFPSLSDDERRTLTRLSLDMLANKRVVVHVGAPSLHQVERLIAQTREEGAKEIAVITPYFLPSTDAALLDFYTRVSAHSDGLGVFVYIFKDRTGITVSPELMAEIAKLPNIIGVKISGESLETVGKFRAVLPDDFLVFTGSDREIGRLTDVGAQGVISGIASVYPEPFVAMADAIASGNTAEREKLQGDINAVVDGLLGDIERLKAGLRRQGIAAGRARMAIGAPDAKADAELDALHAKYGTVC